jgi:hypothetical protein
MIRSTVVILVIVGVEGRAFEPGIHNSLSGNLAIEEGDENKQTL